MSKPDEVPVEHSRTDSREGSHNTLFPIRIPDKSLSVHGSRGPPTVSAFGRMVDEESAVQSTVRKPSESLNTFGEDLKSVSRTDRPVGQYEGIDIQQKIRLQPLKDDASARGGRNERMTEVNPQMIHQRDLPFTDSRVRSETYYHGGEIHPGINRREDVFGTGPERRTNLGERGHSVYDSAGAGTHKDIARVDTHGHVNESRLPRQDPYSGHIHESAVGRAVDQGFKSYFDKSSFPEREQTFESRNRRLEEDSKKEIIPGLSYAWNESGNKGEQRPVDYDTQHSGFRDNFGGGRQLGQVEQRVNQQGFVKQGRVQLENFRAGYDKGSGQTGIPDRNTGGRDMAANPLAQPKGPAQLLPVHKFREADVKTEIKPSSDDLLKHIYKTLRGDAVKGMFYCAVCQLFLANENERVLHANSEMHKIATASRGMQQPYSRQQAPMAGNVRSWHDAPLKEFSIHETGQFNQHAVMGHRGTQYTGQFVIPQGNHPGSLGTMAPRYPGHNERRFVPSCSSLVSNSLWNLK